MKTLCTLVASLFISAIAWASAGQLNELYSYEADLRQELAALDQHELARPSIVPPLLLELPRKGKLYNHDDDRIKLPRDTQIYISGVTSGRKYRWWTVTPVDSSHINLRMREHKSFAAEFAEEWLNWRRITLEDSLRVLRDMRIVELRRWVLSRELGEVNAVAKLFRKPGRHTMMDPVSYLHSRVIPEWRQAGAAIVFAWKPELELAEYPWGYPVQVEMPLPENDLPLLVFDGMQSGTYCMRPVRCETTALERDGYYFATPAGFEAAMGQEAAGVLASFAEDLRIRQRENRRYELLGRWAPDVVSRVLDGLVWKGMSEQMLDEALGTPAELSTLPDGRMQRTYAAGNIVILRGDTVDEIRQSKE